MNATRFGRRFSRALSPVAADGRERSRVIGLGASLLAANAGAWICALVVFRDYPIALGTALLAYGLGLRHAIDADHVAAIDNVTRKLMHDGQRPYGVGFFFSLGHSTVVVLASVAIAATADRLWGPLSWMRTFGESIGTIVSAAFLAVIAAVNLFVLISVYRALRAARAASGHELTESSEPRALDVTVAAGGLLARVMRPLFRLIHASWQMYPLGFLFGLGFDTASEVGLLAISAAEASRGMPIWSIMIFALLFTAGMSLLDTADSVLMVGAYGWAFRNPIRKLYYNVVITLTSVLVALFVGGLEVVGLARHHLRAAGADSVASGIFQGSAGRIGLAAVLLFAGLWAIAVVLQRRRPVANKG